VSLVVIYVIIIMLNYVNYVAEDQQHLSKSLTNCASSFITCKNTCIASTLLDSIWELLPFTLAVGDVLLSTTIQEIQFHVTSSFIKLQLHRPCSVTINYIWIDTICVLLSSVPRAIYFVSPINCGFLQMTYLFNFVSLQLRTA